MADDLLALDEAPEATVDLTTPPEPSAALPGGGDLSSFTASLGLAPVDTTRSDALLREYLQAGKDRRVRLEASAARQRDEVALAEDEQQYEAARREAERPGPLSLPAAPNPPARAFAEPRPDASFLTQLHTLMLGAGQLAIQMTGLAGNSTAALASAKGALEGWAAGDTERANRDIQAWERETKRLLAEHQDRVQQYKLTLDDDKMGWDQRFALMRMRSGIDGFADMAAASEQQDIGKALASVQRAEQLQASQQQRFAQTVMTLQQRRADLEEKRRQHDLEAARHKADRLQRAADAEANRDLKADLTRQAQEASERLRVMQIEFQRQMAADRNALTAQLAADRNALTAQMSADRLAAAKELRQGKRDEKYEPMKQAVENSLTHLDRVESAIRTLAKHEALTENSSWMEKRRVDLVVNSTFGKAGNEISEALDTLKREGTAIVVGAERALGQQASTMRLKSVAEAEIGNLPYVSKKFWDGFLPTLREAYIKQLSFANKMLGEPDTAAPTVAAPALPPGAKRVGNDIVSESGKYIWRGGKWQPR